MGDVMTHRSKQVMLPFSGLPTTDCVRASLANVIRDIQREHDLTDQQLAEAIGAHVNTIQRARNKLATLDNLTVARLGATFGEEALRPYTALWSHDAVERDDVVPALADAMAAVSRAKGPKGEFDALPVVKDCIEALHAFVLATERKRLRVVA